LSGPRSEMAHLTQTHPGAVPAPSDRPRVAVVGGGFAGACVAIHLLRQTAQPIDITVIEPRPALGHGLAYGTEDPAHRINVPSDKMSVFAQDPLHFSRWLERTGQRAADPDGEAPPNWHYSRRQVFGAYMADTLEAAIAAAVGGTRVFHVRDRAVAVTRTTAQAEVDLESGASLAADRVIFVASHERPVFPFTLGAATASHPGIIHDPWDHAALTAITPDKHVAILGTGLTMVDVAGGLIARGHKAPITAISRRGQLPQAHGAFEPLVDVMAECGQPASARSALRMARTIARREVEAGRGWHTAIDGIRRVAETIWRGWPEAEQRRALARLRPFWDTHRYRVAPQLHERLTQARSDERLDIRSARATGIVADGDKLDVTLRNRDGSEYRLTRDIVVNCMGPSPDITRSANPIIRDILDQGLARPDAHRLGFDVADDFCLLRRNGAPAPELRAVGPLTRGVFWEVIGVPELSDHCLRLAAQLAGELENRTTAVTTISA